MAAGLTTMGTAAQAAPPPGDTAKSVAAPVDDLPSPAEEKQRALRQEALSDVLSGKKKPERRGDSTVVRMGTKPGPTTKGKNKRGHVDQYVELSREKTDKIFVVLAEFGNERHPSYPDQDTSAAFPGPATFEGPLNNAIPQPDRSV
ncbi:MAG: protease, partial [Actinophytocola sp.]